jgi:hypothetical protein
LTNEKSFDSHIKYNHCFTTSNNNDDGGVVAEQEKIKHDDQKMIDGGKLGDRSGAI